MSVRAATISIALATYNGARFLDEQLRSLAGQTSLPDELVVRDDGSSDATLDRLEMFARSAPFPVRIERGGQRLGFQRNFLRCAALCRGDYVSFCDQDDIWDPRKIEALRRRIALTGSSLVFHNATVFDEGGERGPLYLGDPRSAAPYGIGLVLFAPWGFTATFDRDLLRHSGFHAASGDPYNYGRREAHDQWVHFVSTLTGPAEYLPETLARYRQHGSNLVGTPHRARLPSIASSLAASSGRQAALWDCARRRLKVVRALQRTGDADRLPRLDEMADMYGRVLAIATRRKTVYTSRSWGQRARAIKELAGLGAYGSDGARPASGKADLAKDVLVGLPFAPLLRRPASAVHPAEQALARRHRSVARLAEAPGEERR